MKRLMWLVAVVVLAGLLLPVACARYIGKGVPERAPVPAPPVPAPAPRPAAVPAPSIAVPSLPQERMIVRNGDMALVVKDVVKTRDDIAGLATRLDGYVVSSSISGKDQELRGSIVIRVPDSKFESTLAELRKLAVRVRSERTSSQDVTEEYTDLKARLKNAEATESQLLALLQRADKVEDILKIYQQLSQVRREIEQIKGRMQLLERTAAMSLISVSLEPETSAAPVVPVAWSFTEILKSAARGFVTFGQWFVAVLIWAVIFIPVWGTVAGVIYWRRLRKRRAAG